MQSNQADVDGYLEEVPEARREALSTLRDRFRDELTSASLGKGCIRYSSPGKIDFDLVRRILEASAAAEGRIC